MLTNAKQITTIAILIAVTSSIATYSWNNKTIEQQLEEQNTAILQDCLSNAGMKQVPSEILEATSHCNKDLLKTIYSPSYSIQGSKIKKEASKWEIDCLSQFKNENEQFTCWMSGADFLKNQPAYKLEGHSSEISFREFKNKYGTHSTGNTVPPLGFQLIPSANASASDAKENGKSKVPAIQSNLQAISAENVTKETFSRTPINSQILIYAGINANLAKEIVNVCNNLAKDHNHCIKYASAVSGAESGGGKKCYNNNCFGIRAGTIGFKTLNDGVIDWVTRYNKYWWKATSISQFYAPRGKLPYFRYCTSEISSNSSIGCPNGLKHASSVFNKIN